MNGYRMKPSAKINSVFVPPVHDNPASVDWRTSGYVTPIKDQGITNLDEIFTSFINNSIEYHNSRGRYK